MCLFVSIAIAPNSIVFLEKNNNFLLSTPSPPRCTYLLVSFYFLQSIFLSVCSRGGGLLIVLASCWLQAAGGPFGSSAFPFWRCAGASSGCISQELWLAGPCVNGVLFLAAILTRYFQALRNLAENSFFLSFFLSKSLLYIVVMRNNGFSVLLC